MFPILKKEQSKAADDIYLMLNDLVKPKIQENNIDLSYDISRLLVNCDEEEIQGIIYSKYKEYENKGEEIIMENLQDYVLEKTLGTWLMILPQKRNIDDKYLRINQQRLVTPYDIYNTLLDMFGYKFEDKVFSRKGKSVFNKINGLERDCEYYSQDILTIYVV